LLPVQTFASNWFYADESDVLSENMVIKEILKLPVTFILKQLDLYSLYSLKKIGPLEEDGWFRSVKENRCLDAEGNPLPWMTYPAIDFLKTRIGKEMSVFEYGCGESTLWWSKRVKEVTSVENDKFWYGNIAARIPENVNLLHIDLEYGGSYSSKISEYKNCFDIIVIDGRDRINCARNCLGALKTDGVIIWDNSDRQEYESGYNFLYDNGFRKIEFAGFSPIVNIKSETGVFYREINCLKI